MQQIRKYPLEGFVNRFQMPRNAVLLDVQLQRNVPCLWALVDVEQSETPYTVQLLPTGELFAKSPGMYIATVQFSSGLVFHAFVL